MTDKQLDKEPQCRLCLRKTQLVRSHIIPEFCYEPVYDHLHRLIELSTDPKETNKRYKQKGIRESLLCKDCETTFSLWEKHVREVIYGGTEIEIRQDGNRILVSGIDYEKFKLFQMSVLWRAGVSSYAGFNAVQLASHEERLRNMLLAKDPGTPYQYGCLMASIVTGDGKVDVVDGVITSPDQIRVHNHRCYRFVFGGNFWLHVVSRHSHEFPNREYFLTAEGELTMRILKAEDTGYFTEFARRLKTQGKLENW